MSVVAVRVTNKKITIGADSILVSGWTQEKDKLAKLNEVNGMVIGDCGDAQEGGLFLIYCKTRKELSHPPSPKYFFHQNTSRNNNGSTRKKISKKIQ